MLPKPSSMFTGMLMVLAFGLSLIVASSTPAQQNVSPHPLRLPRRTNSAPFSWIRTA